MYAFRIIRAELQKLESDRIRRLIAANENVHMKIH